jgi:hypothetical protein
VEYDGPDNLYSELLEFEAGRSGRIVCLEGRLSKHHLGRAEALAAELPRPLEEQVQEAVRCGAVHCLLREDGLEVYRPQPRGWYLYPGFAAVMVLRNRNVESYRDRTLKSSRPLKSGAY